LTEKELKQLIQGLSVSEMNELMRTLPLDTKQQVALLRILIEAQKKREYIEALPLLQSKDFLERMRGLLTVGSYCKHREPTKEDREKICPTLFEFTGTEEVFWTHAAYAVGMCSCKKIVLVEIMNPDAQFYTLAAILDHMNVGEAYAKVAPVLEKLQKKFKDVKIDTKTKAEVEATKKEMNRAFDTRQWTKQIKKSDAQWAQLSKYTVDQILYQRGGAWLTKLENSMNDYNDLISARDATGQRSRENIEASLKDYTKFPADGSWRKDAPTVEDRVRLNKKYYDNTIGLWFIVTRDNMELIRKSFCPLPTASQKQKVQSMIQKFEKIPRDPKTDYRLNDGTDAYTEFKAEIPRIKTTCALT